MALDPTALITPGTPEYWMHYLAARLLDRNRTVRLATLDAYRCGCPPLPQLSASDRRGFYRFHRLSRTNMARKVVRSAGDRMRVRGIRTAAATDSFGDAVAWRYWTDSALDITSTDVHSDMLTFSEAYVRVSITDTGRPIALRRDPRFCIALPDPLNPLKTLVSFELLWDELTQTNYAYLWMLGKDADGQPVGQQWVASTQRSAAPRNVVIPGISSPDARRFGWWWPHLTFNPGQFDMRPHLDDIPPAERDGGPYCQTLPPVVPVVRFDNRDGVGEFEDHLDVLDRILQTVLIRVISAAVQAYKQRALTQEASTNNMPTKDRLPEKNPDTGERIPWDDLYQPGPDALWKLPPGVKIWESSEVDLKPMLSAAQDDIKTLSAVTDTPLPLLSDDVNQSAEGAQFRREGLVFRIEDREAIAGRKWADVIALMFLFAPDGDRYAPGGRGKARIDRADAGQIVIDWTPAERFSLAERAEAGAKNKTLSVDMAAEKFYGLTPDEVRINRKQRKDDITELPLAYRLSQLPAGIAANEVDPNQTPPAGKPAAPAPPA